MNDPVEEKEYTFDVSDLMTNLFEASVVCHSKPLMEERFLSCKNATSKYCENEQLKSVESQKFFKTMFSYFENLCDFIFERLESKEYESNTDDLTELLEILILLIDCVKSVLYVIVKVSNILFQQIECMLHTSLHLLTKCYKHCNDSDGIYGDDIACIGGLLHKIFQEIYQTHSLLHKLLSKLDCKAYYNESNKISLSKIFKGFLHLSPTISELDKTLLMKMWKSLLCCLAQFESVLNHAIHFEDYLRVFAGHVVSNLELCIQIFKSDSFENGTDFSDHHGMKTCRSLAECFSNSLRYFINWFQLTLKDARVFFMLCVRIIHTMLPVMKIGNKDENSVHVWTKFIGYILKDQIESLSLLLKIDGMWQLLLDYNEYATAEVRYITTLVIVNLCALNDKFSSYGHKLLKPLVESYIRAYSHLSDYYCLPVLPRNNSDEPQIKMFYDVTIQHICMILNHAPMENVKEFNKTFFDTGFRGVMIMTGVVDALLTAGKEQLAQKLASSLMKILDETDDISFQKHICLMLENTFSQNNKMNITTSLASADSVAHCYKFLVASNNFSNFEQNLFSTLIEVKKTISMFLNDLYQVRIDAIFNLTNQLIKVGMFIRNIFQHDHKAYKQCEKILSTEFLPILSQFWSISANKLNDSLASSVIVNDFVTALLELFLAIPGPMYQSNHVQVLKGCAQLRNQTQIQTTLLVQLFAHFSQVNLTYQSEENIVKGYRHYFSLNSTYILHFVALQSFEEFSKTTSSSHILKECVSDPKAKMKVEKYMTKVPTKSLSEVMQFDVLKSLSNVVLENSLIEFVDGLKQSSRLLANVTTTNFNSDDLKKIVNNFITATTELSKFAKDFKKPSREIKTLLPSSTVSFLRKTILL